MAGKIYLSSDNRIIAGVCGGIAKAYNIDPLWPRLIAVLLGLQAGLGIILYLVAWMILEEEPKENKKAPEKKTAKKKR